jgi:hypothetical protein
MLDIYYIEGEVLEIPETPDEKMHIISIDMSQHQSLEKIFEKCEEMGIIFSYFDDSLINQINTIKMLGIFKKNIQLIENNRLGQESYKLLESILLIAIDKNYGLVAYCD